MTNNKITCGKFEVDVVDSIFLEERDLITPYSGFVWCKGEHYKCYVYGVDGEDMMWGLGDTAEEAVTEAVETYNFYVDTVDENTY